MDRYRTISSTARARGLGSAKSGFGHWWTVRITAVALVPLTLWLLFSLIASVLQDHARAIGWLGSPVTTVLMILLLIAGFWHMALGLQVVIEDYVHSGLKIWGILLVRFGCFLLATAGIIASLRIGLLHWMAG